MNEAAGIFSGLKVIDLASYIAGPAATTTTTLTVDRPWEVIPTSESVYAVREIDAYQFLIKDNTLTDNRFGIEHYTGVQQAAIIHNTLTNDGPIWLRSQVHRSKEAHSA